MSAKKRGAGAAEASGEKKMKVGAAASAVLALTVRLNNGELMPRVGFGTYKLKEASVASAVRTALEAGYRLVDTAHVYGGGKTEPIVGRAVGKTTNKVYVITKQWRGFHGYDETLKCVAQSLKRLGVEQIDLLLMHWPGPAYSAMGRSKKRIEEEGIKCYFKKGHEDVAALRLETWRAMEDCVLKHATVKSIGVSNFAPTHLRKLLAWPDLRVRPAVNQIEVHPYLQQRNLVALCKAEGIVVQAYGSLGGQDSTAKDWKALGQPPLLEHPTVLAAARAHDRPPASVLLRWALDHDLTVIPKSSDPTRIRANADNLDFRLTEAHLKALDALNLGGMAGRLCWRRDELRNLDFE